MLKEDHKAVERLFKQFEKASEGTRSTRRRPSWTKSC